MKCVITRLLVTTLGCAFFYVTFQSQLACGENAPATEGKGIFQAKCSPCHTIGGGKLVGPDLKGVTVVRDHVWLAKFISTPDRVLASGDPIANQLLKEYGGVALPNLGLNQTQVGASLLPIWRKVLKEFEDDLHKHVHLENNILFPKAAEL